MKNLLKLVLVFIFIAGVASESSRAQSNRINLGLTAGVSIPSGDFASSDYSNDKSGFAGSGINLGVTGVYFLNKHFGIGGLLSYQSYRHKGAQALADGFKEAFDVDSATVYIKGSNHAVNILIGPHYLIPLHAMAFDFHILGGLTSATIAGNEVFLEDATGNNFSQKTSHASSFGVQAGASVKFNLSPHWGLMGGVDYFYSKPDFSIENVNRVNEAGRILKSYNEPIQGLNTNLSLVYAW